MALDAVESRLRRLEEESRDERREYREDQKDVAVELERLSERIDKLTLAVLGAVLTLAVFGLGIAITLLTSAGH